MRRRPKIGLALGGGGARGITHIGELKVLEQEKILNDLIVGTSIGALVRAAYALYPDAKVLEKRPSEVLNPKEKWKAGFKLLDEVHWGDSVKSDLLRRIACIAQKEMFVNFAIFRNALLPEDDLKDAWKPSWRM